MGAANPIRSGTVFGRLTVISRQQAPEQRKYLCRCSCGNMTSVYRHHLTSGATRSCGCLMVENRTRGTRYRHGHALGAEKGGASAEYHIWAGMIGRCHNPSDRAYRYYGARGISVCLRWRDKFDNFISDMGRRPPGLSIDRIDNDGNYEPGNCRWATITEQLANRRQPKIDRKTGRFMPASTTSPTTPTSGKPN